MGHEITRNRRRLSPLARGCRRFPSCAPLFGGARTDRPIAFARMAGIWRAKIITKADGHGIDHQFSGLESGRDLCYRPDVKFPLPIGRLLAAVAILGLLIAPVAPPAVAMTMREGVHAIADTASAQTDFEMAMPDGMPCCPEKAPLSDDSKGCPMMALCLSGAVLNLPAGAALSSPVGKTSLLFPESDTVLTSLGHGPLPRPPKT
jgi:hypothetical protein